MPVIPETRNLNATAVDILNAIRNSATANYRDYVPVASESLDSIRSIGTILMDYPALQNEFLSALVNRIGRVIITSKLYTNPWSVFKKGMLEFGETIEEIFVDLAKPFEYDPNASETEVFKREMPNVKSAFHVLNYKKFYKTTVQENELRQAFLSWSGISDLISKIINSMYTAAAYDEFNVMKYLIAIHILDGNLRAVKINEVSALNSKGIVSNIKGVSNSYEFMSTKNNKAGVHNFSAKDNQYLIVSSEFDSVIDVEVLAMSFNMTKSEFAGHKILVDSFGEIDVNRLDELFASDSGYRSLTDEELEALKAVPAALIDKDWFMIFDNMQNFTEQYNGQGLYWNYWYHVWKTFSVSPFANASVFVPGTPAITSVTISPQAVTASAGQTVNLTVEVVTDNFASKVVEWSVDDDTLASVDIYGTVHIADDATGSVDVTATSVFDSTKSDTITITIAGGDEDGD